MLTRGSYSVFRNPSGMKFEAKAIPLDRFVNMLINLTNRTVKGDHLKTVIIHVQYQVLSHDCQAYDGNISSWFVSFSHL